MLGLVLSGGGAKGAFEVGVLKALIEREPFYDPAVITGTSVGAINASFLAQYPLSQFQAAVYDLEKLWLNLVGDQDIYRRRPGAWARAAFPASSWLGLGGAGLHSIQPLWRLVNAKLDPVRVVKSGRKLGIVACSITTGKLHMWRECDSSVLRAAVMASAAFPGYFPLVEVDGDLFTDGGAREIAPVREAFELGAMELDVILASPRESFKPRKDPSVLDVAWAVVDMLSNEVKKGDLAVLDGSPHRLFEPKEEILEDSLDFDPKKIRRSIQLGYEVGMEVK